MILFESKPQFDVDTGRPVAPVWQQVAYLCDYCGNRIDSECDGQETAYKVIEVGGAETQYEFEVLQVKNRRVDLHSLYNVHPMFTYCQNWDTSSFCEQRLMLEYTGMCLVQDRSKDPEGFVAAIKTFLENEKLGDMLSSRSAHRIVLANLMYQARHRAVKKMLKKYSPEQLQLDMGTLCL